MQKQVDHATLTAVIGRHEILADTLIKKRSHITIRLIWACRVDKSPGGAAVVEQGGLGRYTP